MLCFTDGLQFNPLRDRMKQVWQFGRKLKFKEVKWLVQVHTVALFNPGSSDTVKLYTCLFPLSSLCMNTWGHSVGRMVKWEATWGSFGVNVGRQMVVCVCVWTCCLYEHRLLIMNVQHGKSLGRPGKGKWADSRLQVSPATPCENHMLGEAQEEIHKKGLG